jgi:hypothetical protein
MKKIKELEEKYLGKKFVAFSWLGVLDKVHYAGSMDEFVGKEITIESICELREEEGYYSVTGRDCFGFYYPLNGAIGHLVKDKTEKELTEEIFELIKKVI